MKRKAGITNEIYRGFWVRSERANASYASQGFYAKKTAYGMQIVAPERQVLNRADAMNISTITIDFIAYAKNNILVKAKHYEGYENGEARFELRQEKVPFEVTITEQEAVLETGDVTVRYDHQWILPVRGRWQDPYRQWAEKSRICPV